MATNLNSLINRLQKACNSNFDAKLLVNKGQIYSKKKDKPITVFSVKKAVIDEITGKVRNEEIFNTTCELHVVLFLRDYWYELNGWEIPEDNEKWEKAKEKYKQRQQKGISMANQLP